MLEELIGVWLNNLSSESNAVNIIRTCRTTGLFHIGIILGEYLHKYYPHNLDILDELGICYFYSNQYLKSFETFQKLIQKPNLNEQQIQHYQFNSHFSIPYIKDTYIQYNKDIVQEIQNHPKRKIPFITFTITPCKRIDLFTKTINSFLNCCQD